jgi:molybdate transport system substrate-binding protein
VQGDVWAVEPLMTLYAGGMLRPVLEPIVKAFCEREGVVINRSYNGCGILVAQIRNGALPDAYAACDQAFLDMVQPQFEPGQLLSRNQIVLLVPKGNPAKLRTPQDLARPGLRIGLASVERSALGALSVDALTKAGLMDAIRSAGNIAVESPTGDFLVNQVRVGALDGALVYRSNAMATPSLREHTEVVELNLPGGLAAQPWSVRLRSPHAHTLGRLLNRIETARADGAFASLGFLPPEPTLP